MKGNHEQLRKYLKTENVALNKNSENNLEKNKGVMKLSRQKPTHEENQLLLSSEIINLHSLDMQFEVSWIIS